MIDHQLYLLAGIFSSRGDFDGLSTLLKATPRRSEDGWVNNEILDCICAFWPESADPEQLMGVWDCVYDRDINIRELISEFLRENQDLVPALDVDAIQLEDRYQAVRAHVNSFLKTRCPKLNNTSNWNRKALWMRMRVLVCNYHIPSNVLFCETLWQKSDDKGILDWIDGIVKPLASWTYANGSKFLIKDWEALDPIKAQEIIISSPHTEETTIECQLIPYLRYTKTTDTFVERFYQIERFSPPSKIDIVLFKSLYYCLKEMANESLTTLRQRTAQILFDCEIERIVSADHISRTMLFKELLALLDTIPENTSVNDYPIDVGTLKVYLKYLSNSNVGTYTPKELYTISQEEDSAQLAHFETICRSRLEAITERPLKVAEENTVQIRLLLLSLLEDYESTKPIFNKLDDAKRICVLTELLVENGHFEYLEIVLGELRLISSKLLDKVKERVLVRYFWSFFNSASNGLPTERNMAKAAKILNLVIAQGKNDTSDHLYALMDLSYTLSKYVMNLSPGLRKEDAFKPSNILEYKTHPFDIVSNLLELNPKLRKDTNTTWNILQKIHCVLESDQLSLEKYGYEFMMLLSLHIQHCLANFEFTQAYKYSLQLLDLLNERNPNRNHEFIASGKFWSTIYQVGKFIDPNWPDGEIPTEIIILQMSLLSNLLKVCPLEEIDLVASQWSSLELELTSRDLIHDSYSIEMQGTSDNQSNSILPDSAQMITKMSHHVSRYISNSMS